MISLSTSLRYLSYKFEYAVAAGWKYYKEGKITKAEVGDVAWKNLLQGKMTFLHWYKGEEMVPTIVSQGGTLLVRKIPVPRPTVVNLMLTSGGGGYIKWLTLTMSHVLVGDVVVLKHPEKHDDLLVRRLAAVEGYEMASKDEKEESFVLDEGECWVLSDNEALKPKEAKDSRTFGPVQMSDIIGRVIYCLRSAVDHGPVQNNELSMRMDSPILEVELDIDDMAKNHKP